MENPQSARGGTLASKRQTFNKRQFIQYEPEMVEELNHKKTRNQSVSGRLLTLLYKRLLFWSRYSKHQYNGRRYFWKSIPSLSEELQYSEKQVARGLKALVELGLIQREKLNKHNWKHHYYYYLPKSVHTAEPDASTTRTSSSSRSTTSSFGAGSGRSGASGARAAADPLTPVPTAAGASGARAAADPLTPVPTAAGARRTSTKGTGGAPAGTAGSPLPVSSQSSQSVSGASVRTFCGDHINRRNPLLEKQLRTIAEKCLDYGVNPPKPLTGRGFGFGT
jgi:DNA-binding MarR family transcriptional regulator